MGSQVRESALLNCCDGAREGILDLSDRLPKICFLQGLASDRVQTIVRRNYRNFHEITETAFVEESAITWKQDRYRAEGSALPKRGSCGEVGHSSNKCFARAKREARVNPVVTNAPESSSSSK